VLAFVVVVKPYKDDDDGGSEEGLPDAHRMHVVALTAALMAFGLG
jgi:hypothetical protein